MIYDLSTYTACSTELHQTDYSYPHKLYLEHMDSNYLSQHTRHKMKSQLFTKVLYLTEIII